MLHKDVAGCCRSKNGQQHQEGSIVSPLSRIGNSTLIACGAKGQHPHGRVLPVRDTFRVPCKRWLSTTPMQLLLVFVVPAGQEAYMVNVVALTL